MTKTDYGILIYWFGGGKKLICIKRCSPYPHIVKLVVEFVDTFTVAHHLESSLVKIWGCRKSDDDGGGDAVCCW